MKSLFVAGWVSLLIVGNAFSADAQKGAAKGDAAKGKDLFAANCSVCHNADNTDRKLGPGLKGLFKHPALANLKKVTDANVMAIVNEGGNSMPPFKAQLSKTE